MKNLKNGQRLHTGKCLKPLSRGILLGTMVLLCVTTGPLFGQEKSRKMRVVPKWERFETEFKSAVTYTNPLQEATLKVVFNSPLGTKTQIEGFWDGARTWRVRFNPDQPGRWTYNTSCSDSANRGLNGQQGEFLCTTIVGEGRFQQHGPVRVARDRRHFEHADGTPFFWLGDTALSGARLSTPPDWELYAAVRQSQGYSVTQCAAAPGDDQKGESALTGFPDRIGVNPEFFKRLDAKLETLRRADLLSAIVPLWETDTSKAQLKQDQAVLVLRYMVARWGTDPIAWLLEFPGDNPEKLAERWRKIGRAVFGGALHAPVIVNAGLAPGVLETFRSEDWVDALGLQTAGPKGGPEQRQAFAAESTKEPARPLIGFTPYENALKTSDNSGGRYSAEAVRQAAYWGVLLAPAAGVSYGGAGVVDWDATTDQTKTPGARLPLWQRSLFMPAAKQMGYLGRVFNSLDFSQLRPNEKLLISPSGDEAVAAGTAVASTGAKDLVLVYVPEGRALRVSQDAMPPSPQIRWFNPRTSGSGPAVAVVSGSTCQFPPPGPGDWLLTMRTQEKTK
ncbi:MAG TPA: DUF4038 domain-containing protein [Verrucomicrobiae bacterium]|nr:DUF4038 domain-containing protein [Verrucomicrobiae bacterium]